MTVLTIATTHKLPQELVKAGMLPGKRVPAAPRPVAAVTAVVTPEAGLVVDLAVVPIAARSCAGFLPMNMAALLDCPARDLVPHFALAADCAEWQAAGSDGRRFR